MATEQSIWSGMRPAREYENVDAKMFRTVIEPLNRPAVLRGLVKQWPAVISAQKSPKTLGDYLCRHSNDKPISTFIGDPKIHGRFFYGDNLQGDNFARRHLPLSNVVSILLQELDNAHAPAIYAGAVSVPEHLPGLLSENMIDVLDSSVRGLASIWIGNRTRIAAHWDQQENIACVIGGRRRYTLFPIQQMKNLYIGPLDRTPAGPPISLVDFHRPDDHRFPRFRQALEHAEVAELGPGDALYMPSFWIHHSESLDRFGLMMNFWWQPWVSQPLSAYLTMLHSLLSIRDLPPTVRENWRVLFDYYVFQTADDPMGHIPPESRGIFAALTPEHAHTIIAHLQQTLDQLKSSM